MNEPWPVGTDSGDALRKALQAFIKQWMADAKYKARLPVQHFAVLLEGEKQEAGRIHIVIVSQADPRMPWPFKVGQSTAVDDFHQIAVVVKADQKTGGAKSVTVTFGMLRALFAPRDGDAEYSDLISRGVCNCFEAPEGFDVAGADDYDEAVFSAQTLSLKAKTTTFLT